MITMFRGMIVSDNGSVSQRKRCGLEKINEEVVCDMSDEELTKHLQFHGDRLALMRFCKQSRNKTLPKMTRKQGLLEKLRKKLRHEKKGEGSVLQISSDEEEGSHVKINSQISKKMKGNINAKKISRRVDIGWIINEGPITRQVRMKKGGGTRKCNFHKDINSLAILETAKELFFPNGRNIEGNIEDFDFELWDFLNNKLEDHVTVAEMYEQLKFGTIRVYLASKRKRGISECSDEDSIVSKAARLAELPNDDLEYSNSKDELPDLSSDGSTQATEPGGSNSADINESSNLVLPNLSPGKDKGDIQTDQLDNGTRERNFDPILGSGSSGPSSESTSLDVFGYINDLDDSEVTFPHLHCDLNLFRDIPEIQLKERTIEVHKGRILNDLIVAFKDPGILDCELTLRRKNQAGILESGEGSGMNRDIFSEFWSDCYEQCTVGCTYKVPFTRHDYQEEEWRSVARIILKGWQMCGYFPISIAPVIMEECLYGSYRSDILEVFFEYLPSSDSTLLKRACADFSSVEEGEILEILETHNGRKLPTDENLKALCKEIALKELIQDTKFVVEVWKHIISPLKWYIGDLQEIYGKMVPTAKTLIKMMHFPDAVSVGQADTISYMKKLLKEMDQAMLKDFARFCTGSDLLLNLVKKIEVEFVHMEGLCRRPIAHTCGCVLKLSDNFANYPEFRSEFYSVLRSGMWVMDFL